MRPCIIENLKYHTINSHCLLLRYSVFYWSHISISEIYTLHEKLWKVRWPYVEKMHLYFYFIKLMPVYLQTALPSIDLVVKVFASVGLWVRILDLIWAQKFTFLSKKTNQPLLFVFIMDKKQVECPVNSQPLKKKKPSGVDKVSWLGCQKTKAPWNATWGWLQEWAYRLILILKHPLLSLSFPSL